MKYCLTLIVLLLGFSLQASEDDWLSKIKIYSSELETLTIHNISSKTIELSVDSSDFFSLTANTGRFIECEGKEILILQSTDLLRLRPGISRVGDPAGVAHLSTWVFLFGSKKCHFIV